MKTKLTHQLLAALLGVAFTSMLHAQTSAFTYQGQLTESGSPANGIYDLRFSIYDLDTGGTEVAGPLTNSTVAVSNGVFTVSLDFGASVFDGSDRWLEIGVVTNGGGAFAMLSPRQPITATPYAVRALNLSSNALSAFSGPVSFSNPGNSFYGAFSGDGSGLTNIIVTNLVGMGSSNAWLLGGNAGTTAGTHFIGTTDNQAFEIRADNRRAFRLEPTGSNSVNIIGGYIGNYVPNGVVGATIAGGGAGNFSGFTYTNRVLADFGSVGGGWANTSSGFGAAVGGGDQNIANGYASTISGGSQNSVGGLYATVSGGLVNSIGSVSACATIAGGGFNAISRNSDYSSIGGGRDNRIETNSLYGTMVGIEADHVCITACDGGR